jgi:hypothetical protein
LFHVEVTIRMMQASHLNRVPCYQPPTESVHRPPLCVHPQGWAVGQDSSVLPYSIDVNVHHLKNETRGEVIARGLVGSEHSPSANAFRVFCLRKEFASRFCITLFK